MKHFGLSMLLAVTFAPGCDDDDGDTSDSSNDDSATDDAADEHGDAAEHDADGDGDGDGDESETCVSSHECINGACVCTTESLEDQSCTDEDLCVAECEVCA